jgi:hypothetical protein
MRPRHFVLVFLLAAIIGCAPDAPTTSPIEFTDQTAEYHGHVSGLYGIATSTTGLDIDLQWRDSLARVMALSDHQGKPALVAFLKLMEGASDTLISELDSVQRDMGDSAFILAVVEDRTPHSFASAVYYDSTHNFRIQLVTDSAERAHTQFAQFSDGKLWHPETFILKRDGHLSGAPSIGYADRFYWEDKIRELYK